MKKYDVVISDHAYQDLQNIYEYIALVLLAPDNASGQLSRLEKAIEKLETFPEKNCR